MKINLPLLGKTKDPFIETGIQEYSGRLKHYTPINLTILKVKKKKGWTLHDFGLTVSKRNIF